MEHRCERCYLFLQKNHMGGGGNSYQNSCQSCFSGVYLVFEVFQDTWRSNKDNPSVCWHVTLSCPFMASNYVNLYLVPISFWMLNMPWILDPISFYRRASRCVVFQTKVAHLCFCLVCIKMSLLIWAGGGVTNSKKTSTGTKVYFSRRCRRSTVPKEVYGLIDIHGYCFSLLAISIAWPLKKPADRYT